MTDRGGDCCPFVSDNVCESPPMSRRRGAYVLGKARKVTPETTCLFAEAFVGTMYTICKATPRRAKGQCNMGIVPSLHVRTITSSILWDNYPITQQ